MEPVEKFPWWYVPVCGGLWGLGVTLADGLVQPIGDMPLNDLSRYAAIVFIQWAVTGMIWAAGAKVGEETARPWLLWPAVQVCASLTSFAISFVSFRLMDDPTSVMGQLMMRAPPLDIAAHLFWSNLFYGGLYFLGYAATRRTLRLRRRLIELRLARNEVASRLGEIRLRAVRGQIQPEVLLEALETLKARYNQDTAAGNVLFDKIIDFLRAAMPGLRSGTSTLAAEFAVLDAYAALRESLDDKPPPWRLSLAAAPAELAFPPLRLLPLLDQIRRNAPLASQIEVHAGADADDFVVEIAAYSPALEEDAMRRLRISAQHTLGIGAAASGIGSDVVAELRFPFATRQPVPVL